MKNEIEERYKNEKRCGKCRFYRGISYNCRRHSPTIVREKYEIRGIGHNTVYPTVAPDDWCGDFEWIE